MASQEEGMTWDKDGSDAGRRNRLAKTIQTPKKRGGRKNNQPPKGGFPWWILIPILIIGGLAVLGSIPNTSKTPPSAPSGQTQTR